MGYREAGEEGAERASLSQERIGGFGPDKLALAVQDLLHVIDPPAARRSASSVRVQS